MGVYKVKVTFTPTNKRDAIAQYEALELTVGCIVTSITQMATTGMTLTYKIYKDGYYKLDFGSSTNSPVTQVQDCGYSLTRTWAYADGTGFTTNFGYDTGVFTGGTDGELIVNTTNLTKVGTYKINITQSAVDTFSKLYKTAASASGSPAGD